MQGLTFDDDASEDHGNGGRLFLLALGNGVLPIPLHWVVHDHHCAVFYWNIKSIFFIIVWLELIISPRSERY